MDGTDNAVIRPTLFVLTLPFLILTLGLFTFVLNAFMLWLTSAALPSAKALFRRRHSESEQGSCGIG